MIVILYRSCMAIDKHIICPQYYCGVMIKGIPFDMPSWEKTLNP